MIVLVNDFFIEDLGPLGISHDYGLEEVLRSCPDEYLKVRCSEVTTALLKEHKNAHWLIGTYYGLPTGFVGSRHPLVRVQTSLNTVRYSTLEFDERHCVCQWYTTGTPCPCRSLEIGRRAVRLWRDAHAVFFRTRIHRDRHVGWFPRLARQSLKVCGAVYPSDALDLIEELHQTRKPKNVWAILNGGSHKNPAGAVERCQEMGRKYKLIGGGPGGAPNIPPAELLRQLSTYRGLVFHPLCRESESRITVEAKLLGLEVDINDNIPVKNEPWFTGPREGLVTEVRGRAERFWELVVQ